MFTRPSSPIPPRRPQRFWWAVAAAVWATAAPLGCGRPAGVVFDPANGAYTWPPPPDEPRIRYVGELRSSADLKPAQGFGTGVGELLFGKEAPAEMVSPLGVCTDGAERVFVADSNGAAVHLFDIGTRKYQRWTPPKEKPPFVQPVAVAWDGQAPGGRLLVADSGISAVVAFDGQGRYLGLLGAGQLKRPCGIAVHPGDRRIFVVDTAAHQVVVFAADGNELERIGRRGEAPGEFNYPTNAAFDGSGRLFVSDTLNFRVQVFDSELRPVFQIGRKGDRPGYFSQPKGVSVDPAGRVYVVDANFEAVQVFDPDGTLLMSFGKEGRGPGEFWLPAGLNADPSGRIWVADSYNRRVQVFRSIGEGTSP